MRIIIKKITTIMFIVAVLMLNVTTVNASEVVNQSEQSENMVEENTVTTRFIHTETAVATMSFPGEVIPPSSIPYNGYNAELGIALTGTLNLSSYRTGYRMTSPIIWTFATYRGLVHGNL